MLVATLNSNMKIWLRHETKGALYTRHCQRILHLSCHQICLAFTISSLLTRASLTPNTSISTAHEQRVTITPETAKALLESSSVEALHVERSPTRIFPDAEYEKAGCIMEDTNAWMTLAPDDNTLIVGLKELMASDAPVVHKHTYFAHVFKNQEVLEWVME